MTIEYIWNITLDHQHFTDMFVASGMLYVIKSDIEGKSDIPFAIDLYEKSILHIGIHDVEGLKGATMIDYNDVSRVIFNLVYYSKIRIFIRNYLFFSNY